MRLIFVIASAARFRPAGINAERPPYIVEVS